METAFKVLLDVSDIQNQASISIKQGNTSGKLYVSLCANRREFIIPEGATASLRMLKDGSPVFNACEIQNNVVVCDIGFVTETVGAHDLELAVYKDGKCLITQTLIVKVYANVYGDVGEGEIVDSEPFSALTELVSEATDLIHEVETKLENGDFVGEKGEQGKDGKDGTIITVNGEEQSTWNADTKADVEEVESVREETNMLWDEVFIIYDDLNHASTRIDKVEQDTKLVKEALFQKGIIAHAEVEQAYTSRVTADGQNIVDGQKTPVTMIKGSTVRCENLLVYPYPTTSNTTNNGITWTFDEQGVITVNGTSTAISAYYLMNSQTGLNKAGTYTISMVNGSTSYYLEIEKRDIATGKWLWGAPVNGGSYTFTLNEGECFVVQTRVASGVTANNQKIYVMLNEGSTALPWQPYFTGLKHAKIDSIVSTGANLLDISKLVGNALVDNGDGTYTMTKNGDKRFSNRWVLNPPMLFNWFYSHMEVLESTLSGGITVRVFYKDGTSSTHSLQDISAASAWLRDKVIYWVDFYLNGNETDGAYIKFKKPAFTSNVFSKDFYTPFIQETYQLPETLELPEWDRFNPQTGEITRATSEQLVFTGDEEWSVEGAAYGGKNFYTNPIENASGKQSIICNYYNSNVGESTSVANNAFITTTKRLNITASNFTTVEEWKAFLQAQAEAGNPLIVEYQLATPPVEKLEYAPKSYPVYNQGNETAVLENEEFGAIPTITNEYIVVL